VDVLQIFSTGLAFAALRSDGSVVTWGSSDSGGNDYGGDSSMVATQLNGAVDVKQIFSTGRAFAALRSDGSVVTWGNSLSGADSRAVAAQLNGTVDVTQIFSTQGAFAALRSDGSVVTWGDSPSGADSRAVATQLNGAVDVTQIFSTQGAFAALRSDGSVVTWGHSGYGGDNSAVATQLNGSVDVKQIFSTGDAFAALRSDGSVVTWGGYFAGDSSAVAAQLNGSVDVTQIFSTDNAFAALRSDGSVVTWGRSDWGGDSSAVATQLNGAVDVKQIFSTNSAFAALRSDGSVVTWGASSGGGDSGALGGQLASGVVSFANIYTNDVFSDGTPNHAPFGTDRTVTLLEDGAYTFAAADFGLTDPNDNPVNILLAVKITTLPVVGSLKLNGVAVTAGQSIAVADLTAGKLVFSPAANLNGTGYASFTFQVQDSGVTANGGANLDQSPNTFAFNVTAVNDTPAGTNATKTILEGATYTFAATDFGLTDPNDSPANALLAVKVATLPGAGSLKLNGVAVTAGQSVAVADITAGKLVFSPATNANGSNYASFTFQVQDNGGTGNGGVDLDASPNTFSFNITAVNDAPAGTNAAKTILEDGSYTFATADFGFTDPNDSPANALLAVKVTTLPGAGSLKLNGVAVTAGQSVAVADITAGKLVFAPAANANGNNYASFTFQVQDNGGTGGGGINLDQSPNTFTFNVTAVNDAPAGTNNSKTILEDGVYAFAATDFGLTDPNDSPANTLLAVKITTLPSAGLLTLNGVAVTAGQIFFASEIAAGMLKFSPAANGTGYASFTFQVLDNGGTANGGANLDQSPNTFAFNITAVNDAPAGTNAAKTILEDGTYTFATADFGFTDPNDSPANALLAVKITALPFAGSLKLNNVAVTAGQVVAVADINSGLLKYSPAANANGTGYANFKFQVQDNGGTANGGVNLDQSPNTFSFNVTAVNDAPAGANNTKTILEDGSYSFAAANFGFTDPNDSPANTLLAVKITTLPIAGSLKLNGVAVTTGQVVAVADINGGLLKYSPTANANGSNYASFAFQVQDNGGTANGGVNLDQSPNTFTFNVTAVRDDLVLTGTPGNDTLSGDLIDAGSYDTLLGLAGNDTLNGLAGNDTLLGNEGNDILNGGTGADTMKGGDGNDIYYVDNTGDSVSETNAVLATGGTDTVYSYRSTYTLGANVENLRILATDAANGTGNGLANVMYAGAGNNVLNGGAGVDTVSYAYATAAVTASLAVTAAQATGGSGSDKLLNFENLNGSSYNDTLTGNSGNNALFGSLGADSLTGGLGADTFKFNSAAETGITAALRDIIQDFSSAQGDKIQLSGIDANSAIAGDQAFSVFAQGAGFSGSFAAQASLYFDQTAHVLYGNNDADATADFSIQLVGVNSLSLADFVA